jgi:ethanolamine utilization protein EutA
VLAEVTPGRSGGLLRTDPLRQRTGIRAVTFSGGVAEYVYGRTDRSYGDLAPLLATRLRAGVEKLRLPILHTDSGIHATVIGASQYTVQVSGSTVCIAPPDATPVRNVPVVTPVFPWPDGDLDARAIAQATRAAVLRVGGVRPVAVGVRWTGAASYRRISSFCAGLVDGLAAELAGGHPLIVVFDGDVGGVVGLHLRDSGLNAPVISIDGIDLREFDYVDIGDLIPASGAVPVVVKSLVFA